MPVELVFFIASKLDRATLSSFLEALSPLYNWTRTDLARLVRDGGHFRLSLHPPVLSDQFDLQSVRRELDVAGAYARTTPYRRSAFGCTTYATTTNCFASMCRLPVGFHLTVTACTFLTRRRDGVLKDALVTVDSGGWLKIYVRVGEGYEMLCGHFADANVSRLQESPKGTHLCAMTPMGRVLMFRLGETVMHCSLSWGSVVHTRFVAGNIFAAERTLVAVSQFDQSLRLLTWDADLRNIQNETLFSARNFKGGNPGEPRAESFGNKVAGCRYLWQNGEGGAAEAVVYLPVCLACRHESTECVLVIAPRNPRPDAITVRSLDGSIHDVVFEEDGSGLLLAVAAYDKDPEMACFRGTDDVIKCSARHRDSPRIPGTDPSHERLYVYRLDLESGLLTKKVARLPYPGLKQLGERRLLRGLEANCLTVHSTGFRVLTSQSFYLVSGTGVGETTQHTLQLPRFALVNVYGDRCGTHLFLIRERSGTMNEVYRHKNRMVAFGDETDDGNGGVPGAYMADELVEIPIHPCPVLRGPAARVDSGGSRLWTPDQTYY